MLKRSYRTAITACRMHASCLILALLVALSLSGCYGFARGFNRGFNQSYYRTPPPPNYRCTNYSVPGLPPDIRCESI